MKNCVKICGRTGDIVWGHLLKEKNLDNYFLVLNFLEFSKNFLGFSKKKLLMLKNDFFCQISDKSNGCQNGVS